MTRRREAETSFGRLRFILTALALATLGGCAAIPNDQPVLEQLDADTGVTIARIGRPIELYRESIPNSHSDRFAFLAPFETNQMGKRETFVWIAVPVEASLASTAPTVEVNGNEIALGDAGREAQFAGLTQSPYKVPTPWISLYYFKATPDVIAKLGEAQDLIVRMPEISKSGLVQAQFVLKIGDDARLREFAARQ